jgi:hypothetical protein
LSGDPQQEYFADGMVDDIITGRPIPRSRWFGTMRIHREERRSPNGRGLGGVGDRRSARGHGDSKPRSCRACPAEALSGRDFPLARCLRRVFGLNAPEGCKGPLLMAPLR